MSIGRLDSSTSGACVDNPGNPSTFGKTFRQVDEVLRGFPLCCNWFEHHVQVSAAGQPKLFSFLCAQSIYVNFREFLGKFALR